MTVSETGMDAERHCEDKMQKTDLCVHCGKQGQGIGVSAPLDPVNKFGCPLIFAKATKRVKCACGINDKTAPAKAFRCPLKGRPCARRT